MKTKQTPRRASRRTTRVSCSRLVRAGVRPKTLSAKTPPRAFISQRDIFGDRLKVTRAQEVSHGCTRAFGVEVGCLPARDDVIDVHRARVDAEPGPSRQ